MRGIANYFSLTGEFNDVSEVPFEKNGILIHCHSYEERSKLSGNFDAVHPSVHKANVEELEGQQIKVQLPKDDVIFSLRSKKDLESLTQSLEGYSIYLDITGLTHSVWAWFVKALLLRMSGNFWILYSEPLEYRFNDYPIDGQIFDLSEKIQGISPLPGLVRLTQFSSENFLFLPLLGFEGARLAHIIEDIQPSRELTFPVVGVPGFQFDFPFHTYHGNQRTLEREGIWKNRRYEKANCPVSIFVLGQELMKKYQGKFLRIALIGTKPHALGAVLLKLANPEAVDLIYDHPVRKKGRTKGKSKTLCYWMNPFKETIKRA